MKKPDQKTKSKASPQRGTANDSARKIGPKQDASKQERVPGPRLVVGIGASAGGLDAFKSFFANMSPDSGMAFVLVQHLSPDHKSMLADLVGRTTSMMVAEAHDGISVEKDRVYVIPPDATLTIENRVLRVVKPAPAREHRRPIDTFFSSLGEDQGENAVCIVLSGTGSDGARGLARIKEFGGLTLAQAEFDHHAMDGMPHSAAATGLVDDVLPVEKMPARLLDYQRHLSDVAGRKTHDGTREDATEHLKAISSLLRTRLGHDFSQYKEKTIVRRIQRRMQVLQIDAVPAYIARLREDAAEIELLFRELLIGVTQFFRDPEAFDSLLTRVISPLFESRDADDPVRIWVPACATGEEVYSIAILVKEEMERRGVRFHVQIFGTDIDAGAVAVARSGRFSLELAGLSPERVERWFGEDGEDRCPIKAIREMCVFSTHSVIKDPPFSKLDLVSCRNLMIYFDPDLQDRVLRTFHYALRPGAALFLGSSESVSRNPKLFSAIDKKHRIFHRCEAETMLPELGRPLPPARLPAPGAPSNSTLTVDDRIDRSARRALEKYSPVYVVIDKRDDVVRFSGSEIGHYLGPSPGAASLNLFDILRKPLRPVVRSALQTMSATKQPVVQTDVALELEGKRRILTVVATPLADMGISDGLCVVAFQDTGRSSDAVSGKKKSAGDAEAVEQELRTTKAQLQAAIDESEIVNEEMKSANEEYQSVNEELQSSNEELETSKEEMQSINEELQTINSEMSSKNGLLVSLNSDLRNLFDSTDIATIFLDNDLRIKSFTPGMTDIFHLRSADRGRPITDIVTMLNYAELQRDVGTVLRKLSLIEREVQIGESGSTFIMRIRPYRTVDNVIEGVVITFFDISERKKTEHALQETSAALRANEERLTAIINQATAGIAEVDLEGRYVFVNDRYCEIVGRSAEELRTLRMQDITHQADLPWHLDRFHRLIADGQPFEIEKRYVRPDGTLVWIHNSVSGLRDADGLQRHALAITLEISERKQSEQKAALLMGELDHRVKNLLSIISAVIKQTLKSTPSPSAFAASMEGRIVAIAKAHSLLTERGGRSEASLRDFIATELAPYARGENLTIAGVDVAFTPKAGLSMAMALHELASNAAKYGALSTPAGKLSVTWEVKGPATGQTFSLTWSETGGPEVQPPTRRGFGTTLIERSLKHEFDATVERQFALSGLRCVIEMPLNIDVGRVRGPETSSEDVR